MQVSALEHVRFRQILLYTAIDKTTDVINIRIPLANKYL